MHIPDGIITIDQALIYWILTILIMAICFYKLQKDSQKDKKIVSMAIFSVFTVIITSLSIPSPLGVPIHFFLIPLIAIILGPYSSSIVAFISLIIQALALNKSYDEYISRNFLIASSVTIYLRLNEFLPELQFVIGHRLLHDWFEEDLLLLIH